MACLGVMGHGIGRSPVRTLHEIHLGTEVVAHAVRANRALLDDRGIALAAEPPAGGVPVVANRDKIIQVLTNLLSNAAKFTPPRGGRRGPDTRRGRRGGGGGHRFRQVGDTLTGKPGGAGLGLPISREIVQHHGGRLSATSVPGRGSCFRMTLPLAHARE